MPLIRIDDDFDKAWDWGLSRTFFDDLFTKTECSNEHKNTTRKSGTKSGALDRLLERMGSDLETQKREWLKELNKPYNSSEAPRKLAFNITELEKSTVVEILAPGRTKDDFQVEVIPQYGNKNIALKVAADKKTKKKDASQEGYISRFAQEDIQFHLQLPSKYNLDLTKSKYEEGVLRIEFPHREEEEAPSKLIAVT